MNGSQESKTTIDPAWISLLFTIPGFLLAILYILLYTGLIYSRPGEELGFRLFFATLFLLPAHFILLFPALLVLRRTRRTRLAFRVKIILDFLTISIVVPFLLLLAKTVGHGIYGGILGGYFLLVMGLLVVVGILSWGWLVIDSQFRARERKE